jgi:hypothetical protein
MLPVIKPAKLGAVVLRNTFRLKFNMHVSTGFSISNGSGSRAYDGEEAHRFLQAHLLHWLEALGWMGKTSEGIEAILSLEGHVLVSYLSILYKST